MELGSLVKYSKPIDGECDLRFILMEHNGDRVMIRLICDEPIQPIECVKADEITLAEV